MAAAPQPAQHSPGLAGVRRLAQHQVVDHDRRVHAQHGPVARPPGHRGRLAPAVGLDQADRVEVEGVLLVGRGLDPEGESELLEDGLPLRRGRGQDERAHCLGVLPTEVANG